MIRVDGIAQEGNETFTINLYELNPTNDVTFRDSLPGTIMDADG